MADAPMRPERPVRPERPERPVRLSGLIAPAYYDLHADLKIAGHAEYWLKGGRGSAKSSFISLEIVLGLMRDQNASAIVYRKVAATLRESVYEQMIWAIERLGLGERFRCRLSPLEIVREDTGQRILFRGADDPGKSKSIKLARGYFRYLWFEELSEFDGMDDVRTIKASVFRGANVGCATLYSYNPPVAHDSWVNREALAPRADRVVHHSDYRQLPEAWLGESFLSEAGQLRLTNERAWRHMYLGEVTGSGGQVFDNLEIRAIGGDELAALHAFYNGLDFGFAVDPDALIRVGWEPRARRLYLLEEYYGAHTPLEVLADRVTALSRGETVRCDSADPRMIAELRRRGVQAIGAKKGPGSVAHGMRWLQEAARIVIDPARCPNAAREFSAYAYRPDGRGGFLSEYPDRDNHLIDAARYALEPVIACREARSVDRRGLGF